MYYTRNVVTLCHSATNQLLPECNKNSIKQTFVVVSHNYSVSTQIQAPELKNSNEVWRFILSSATDAFTGETVSNAIYTIIAHELIHTD